MIIAPWLMCMCVVYIYEHAYIMCVCAVHADKCVLVCILTLKFAISFATCDIEYNHKGCNNKLRNDSSVSQSILFMHVYMHMHVFHMCVHAYTVGVVHSVDIKFGDLAANTD